MNSFLKKHIIFEFPKSLLVVFLFALSIFINGDFWTTTQNSFKVFSTELIVDNPSLNKSFPSLFSVEKNRLVKPHLNLPFFQKYLFSQFYFQENIIQTKFQVLKKEKLEFDNPTIIDKKGNYCKRSDLPDSFPINI